MDIFTLHLLSFDKLFSEKNARNVRQTYRGRTQSRLLASVWSKNKGGGGAQVPWPLPWIRHCVFQAVCRPLSLPASAISYSLLSFCNRLTGYHIIPIIK